MNYQNISYGGTDYWNIPRYESYVGDLKHVRNILENKIQEIWLFFMKINNYDYGVDFQGENYNEFISEQEELHLSEWKKQQQTHEDNLRRINERIGMLEQTIWRLQERKRQDEQ